MAIVHTQTQTCLDSFAEFLGIDPLSFNSLDISACQDCPDNLLCDKIWSQYSHQKGVYSRELLAQHLYEAETKISHFLGTFIKPTWVCEEVLELPRHFDWKRRGTINIEAMRLKTDWSFVRRFGQKEFVEIGTFPVIYSSPDGDSFNELATVTFTTEEDFDICDLKIYFEGHCDDCHFEICPIHVEETAENTFSVTIDAYLLVNPDLYYEKRFTKNRFLNACDPEIFVDNLCVGFERVDTCKPQAEVIYVEDGCKANCQEITVPACAIILDKCEGLFTLRLQTLDDEGCVIEGSNGCCPPNCSCPIKVKLNYQAGCHLGKCEPCCWSGCHALELAAWKLAASELPLEYCNCACLEDRITYYTRNTGIIYKSEGVSYNYPSSYRSENPFGTKVGQIEAFLDVQQYLERLCSPSITMYG